ncbi:pol polyprotein, partial [Pseudoloma neurophilia]
LWQCFMSKKWYHWFSSYKFNNYKKCWKVTEKETYAVLKAVQSWKNWISCSKIKVFTDNKNSTYRTYDFNKKTERWKAYLLDYDIEYNFVPGSSNTVADYLSRKFDKVHEDIYLNIIKIQFVHHKLSQ